MSILDRLFLRIIFKRLCRQGPHAKHVTEAFALIRAAWAAEFTEDSLPTQNAHLRELFNASEGAKP